MAQGGGGNGGTNKPARRAAARTSTATAATGPTTLSPARAGGRRRLRTVLWALVLVGALAALMSARNRWQVERANRRVEIVLDFNELRSLAATQGVPLPDVLRRFKQAGVVSVAVQEDTISALEDARRIAVAESGEGGSVLVGGPGARAKADAPALLRRVENVLLFKTPYKATLATTGGQPRLSVNQPFAIVRGVGVGLDDRTVQLVRDAGLGIVGRVGNYGGVKPRGIAAVLNSLKQAGASTVIFSGDEVLGNKAFIADDPKKPDQISTASELREKNLFYGTVEFGKQKGDPLLTRVAADRVVRVHTVTGGEMVTATMPDNIQRFLLAARERDIRVLFVRLFLDEPDPVEKNVEYVEKIAKGLKDRGELEAGLAHGFDALTVPLYLRALMGLGVAAGFLLLVDSVTAFLAGGAGRLPFFVALGGGMLLLALPVLPVGGYKGVQLASLGAALTFPILGLLRHDLLRPARTGENPLILALVRFAQATVITGLGIAFIVGLLADRLFLIKAETFTGVKATLFIPVVVVALVYVFNLRATKERTFAQAVADARNRFVAFASHPILVWQVAAGLVVLVVLALLVMRSGNDSAVGVSGFELRIRSLLDRVLYARPRFKEMLCHPALLIALLLAARPDTNRFVRLLALPLLLVGAIGQASLLNTFCHLHTPIVVGLWRAFLGLGFGLLLGVIAYFVLDRFVLRRFAPPVRAAS